MKLHTKFKDLGLVVSEKKIFKDFPYESLCQTLGPGAGPYLAPWL